MIEMKGDTLIVSFPELEPAKLHIKLQRTLRIPDDGHDYPLPPGLGAFPLRHVDDFLETVPPKWLEHGGVMLPMFQSEAMWINLRSRWIEGHNAAYPFAIKIATGKINAVSGKPWKNGLNRNPQDYVVAPEQPWLDGYCVEKGVIRQFVAMPLGSGYSAEEQMTGTAEHGGLQIMVYSMKGDVFERRFPYHLTIREVGQEVFQVARPSVPECSAMGFAPGGRMRQAIYDDPFDINDWDRGQTSRCFIHIANSLAWRAITGQDPPTVPPTSAEYTKAGLPWFEYYAEDAAAVPGSEKLRSLKSVATLGAEKGDKPLPENESVKPGHVIALRDGLRKDQVREGDF